MTPIAKSALATNTYPLLDEGEEANGSDVSVYLAALNAQDKQSNERVSVSATDAYVKHLEDALAIVSGHLKLLKLNAGGSEQLQLDLDATGIPVGYVPKANGANGWAWGTPGVGGTSPIDITVTAGETLIDLYAVYIDDTMTAWYIDAGATPPVCGKLRGIVNNGGNIAMGDTGVVRIFGPVSGYTGLTPGVEQWANKAAPGTMTDTRPTVDLDEATLILRMGINTSAGEIMVFPSPVLYTTRAGLGPDDYVTVEHHADPNFPIRKTSAVANLALVTSSPTSYSSTNKDSAVALKTQTGAGGSSLVIDNSGTTNAGVGNAGGTVYREAQSFVPSSAGFLSQFQIILNANTGTPTGTMTWALCRDNAGSPNLSVVLQTGTFTPIASATNTVDMDDEVYLDTGTTYWLIFSSTNAQSSGNLWNIQYNPTGAYASGALKYDTNGNQMWTNGASTWDMRLTISYAASTSYTKLAQSFQLGSAGTLAQVTLHLRKVGSPTGVMTLRIETDSAGSPSGTLISASAVATVDESSVSATWGDITFDIKGNIPLSGSTTYWLVLTTSRAADDDYILWAKDGSSPGYASGEMKADNSGYTALSADAIFSVFTALTSVQAPIAMARAGSGGAEFTVLYSSIVGTNNNTQTTFTNKGEFALDAICVVELP